MSLISKVDTIETACSMPFHARRAGCRCLYCTWPCSRKPVNCPHHPALLCLTLIPASTPYPSLLFFLPVPTTLPCMQFAPKIPRQVHAECIIRPKDCTHYAWNDSVQLDVKAVMYSEYRTHWYCVQPPGDWMLRGAFYACLIEGGIPVVFDTDKWWKLDGDWYGARAAYNDIIDYRWVVGRVFVTAGDVGGRYETLCVAVAPRQCCTLRLCVWPLSSQPLKGLDPGCPASGAAPERQLQLHRLHQGTLQSRNGQGFHHQGAQSG